MMYTGICKAIKHGDIAALRLLIQAAELEEASSTAATKGGFLGFVVDSEGRSVLQLAVETRNIEILKYITGELPGSCLVDLCARKTDASCLPFSESTPLDTAIALGDLKVLELLLDRILSARAQNGEIPSSAAAMWCTVNANGHTPLTAALASGDIRLVKLILRAMKALEQNIEGSDGIPLRLIRGIVKVDDTRVRGDNSLNTAVSTGSPAIVKALLDVLTPEEIADLLTRCDLVGDTALDRAARTGNTEIVKILVKKLGALYRTWVHTPFQVVVGSCMESKDKDDSEQVPEYFSMRLLSNAISSGNARVVRELLEPLSTEDRYAFLSRTSWGYPLAPLHLAFSLGAHECIKVMLDSLIVGPGGNADYVSRMLTQRSGGLTPLHCAVEVRSVETIRKYKIPRKILLKLLTTGASDHPPAGPVFVPDGMNPLQAMLAGPSGDGRPVHGVVSIMKAMLGLLEGDAVSIQCMLSSMDGAGRSTLYTLASLVGSRGVSATDFMSVLDYLEGKVNLRTLLEQKNTAEGISTLDVIHSMERDLYSWGFGLNDCVSQALNRQGGISRSRASGLRVMGDTAVSVSFFLFCILGFAAVCSALCAVCSARVDQRGNAFTAFGIACTMFVFSIILLSITFSHITPSVHNSANRYAVIAGDPRVKIPEPGFNGEVLLNTSREIRFEPESVEKMEAARLYLRAERDPMRVFSSSPSASSTLSPQVSVALLVDDLQSLQTFEPSSRSSRPKSIDKESSVVSVAEEISPGTGVQVPMAEMLCDEQKKGLGE